MATHKAKGQVSWLPRGEYTLLCQDRDATSWHHSSRV